MWRPRLLPLLLQAANPAVALPERVLLVRRAPSPPQKDPEAEAEAPAESLAKVPSQLLSRRALLRAKVKAEEERDEDEVHRPSVPAPSADPSLHSSVQSVSRARMKVVPSKDSTAANVKAS